MTQENTQNPTQAQNPAQKSATQIAIDFTQKLNTQPQANQTSANEIKAAMPVVKQTNQAQDSSAPQNTQPIQNTATEEARMRPSEKTRDKYGQVVAINGKKLYGQDLKSAAGKTLIVHNEPLDSYAKESKGTNGENPNAQDEGWEDIAATQEDYALRQARNYATQLNKEMLTYNGRVRTGIAAFDNKKNLSVADVMYAKHFLGIDPTQHEAKKYDFISQVDMSLVGDIKQRQQNATETIKNVRELENAINTLNLLAASLYDPKNSKTGTAGLGSGASTLADATLAGAFWNADGTAKNVEVNKKAAVAALASIYQKYGNTRGQAVVGTQFQRFHNENALLDAIIPHLEILGGYLQNAHDNLAGFYNKPIPEVEIRKFENLMKNINYYKSLAARGQAKKINPDKIAR